MFRFERPVRFTDLDAARIVYFGRYLDFCHEAIEALFASLPGGYASLTMERDVGIPTVRLAVDYEAPLYYGDVAVVEVEVTRLGTSSATLLHTVRRQSDLRQCAKVEHVIVFVRFSRISTVPIPADVRALLELHMVGKAS